MFFNHLQDVHLKSELQYEMEPTSDVKYLYIFGAIGIFILLIGSINFMNLSTARSAGRSREVGMRKTFGSLETSTGVPVSYRIYYIYIYCGGFIYRVVLCFACQNLICCQPNPSDLNTS